MPKIYNLEVYLDMKVVRLAGNTMCLNTLNKSIEQKEKQNDPLLSNALQNATKKYHLYCWYK